MLFQLIGNMAYTNDKDPGKVKVPSKTKITLTFKEAWSTNLEWINLLMKSNKINGKAAIHIPGVGFVECKIKISADEALWRVLLGLETSSSGFYCITCYSRKGGCKSHIIRSLGETLEWLQEFQVCFTLCCLYTGVWS